MKKGSLKLFVSNSLERLAASYLVHKVIPKQAAALWCTYTRYDVRKFRHTLRRSTPLSTKTFQVTPKTLPPGCLSEVWQPVQACGILGLFLALMCM